MGLLNIFANLAQEGSEAYLRTLPVLEERKRQMQAEERRKVDAQWDFMVTLAKGDPQRAFQIFGDKFLQVAKSRSGLEIPTREVPITERRVIPGQPATPAVTAPRTEEGSLAGFLTQVVTPAVPAVSERVEEVQTGTQRELALPGEPEEMMIDVPGLGRMPISQAKDLLGPEGVRNILKIFDPIAAARLELDELRVQLEGSRFNLDRSRFASDQAYKKAQLEMNQRQQDALEAYRQAQVALEAGRLDVARGHLDVARQRLSRTGSGEGGLGPSLSPSPGVQSTGLDVREIKNKKGVTTHYAINGKQYTVEQATTRAHDWFVVGDARGRELATVLGIGQKQLDAWKKDITAKEKAGKKEPTEKIGGTVMTLSQIEDEMRIQGGRIAEVTKELSTLKGPGGFLGRGKDRNAVRRRQLQEDLSKTQFRLKLLTAARARLQKKQAPAPASGALGGTSSSTPLDKYFQPVK